MRKFLFLFILLILLTACGSEDVNSLTEEKETLSNNNKVEKEGKSLKDEDYFKIATEITNDFRTILEEMGEIHNFNNSNPGDYNLMKSRFSGTITESFGESAVREYVKGFYCECDSMQKPAINNSMIRAIIESPDSETFTINGFYLANIEGTARKESFEFKKENSEWKLNSWKINVLEDKNYLFTSEEIEQGLSLLNDGDMKVTGEYTSSETGDEAYVISSRNESILGVNKRNGTILMDFPQNIKTDVSVSTNLQSLEEALELYNEEYIPKDIEGIIKKITGDAYESVNENMQLVSAEINNELQTIEISGGVRHMYTFNEAIISYNPIEKLVYVATIVNAEEVYYFTNDYNFLNELPMSFQNWRSRFTQYPIVYGSK